MIWQDVALMIGGFVFAPALIVSIIKKVKYPLATSLPTAIALTVFMICYISLGLYLASITTSITAGCWYILAVRR